MIGCIAINEQVRHIVPAKWVNVSTSIAVFTPGNPTIATSRKR